MPTGYTAEIYDGSSDARRFAWRCASAFYLDMRDGRIDDPVPRPERPEPYDPENEDVRAARRHLEDLGDRSKVEKLYDEYVDKHKAERGKIVSDKIDLAKRYASVKAEVAMLSAGRKEPIVDNFLKFMSDQLDQSMQFDCGSMDYYNTLPDSFEIWHENQVEYWTGELEDKYNKNRAFEAQERYVKMTTWLNEVERLFGPPPQGWAK